MGAGLLSFGDCCYSCDDAEHEQLAKCCSTRNSTLHGGCSATIVDTVGSAALVTISKRPGVSIAIHTTYLAGMPAGEDVEVEAKVLKVRLRPSAAPPCCGLAYPRSDTPPRPRRWAEPSPPSA